MRMSFRRFELLERLGLVGFWISLERHTGTAALHEANLYLLKVAQEQDPDPEVIKDEHDFLDGLRAPDESGMVELRDDD